MHKYILLWYMEGVAKKRALRKNTEAFVHQNRLRELDFLFGAWQRALADVKQDRVVERVE